MQIATPVLNIATPEANIATGNGNSAIRSTETATKPFNYRGPNRPARHLPERHTARKQRGRRGASAAGGPTG
ncbi:hypothetical protein [Alkalicoccus urumqiensis]|uniref:Uncharacterized protein n=1 Tax=Alkalicoccus urumqiensis TaxID=1548213 RepID=A0A2P6MID4_ALKUR|nr:hypothetical protein [Alkalicoccus urumqiensis]PRO66054.1 hypothetical protein C6I21_07065 [Alkalicoccus urumqiensis]